MLPIPSGALSTLLPAQAQLSAVTLPKWRELLRKLKANGSVEESSSAFQAAKERVLLRIQQRRERARLDPNRAFRRLSDRMLQARMSLRELKNAQKRRLRQYYYEAVRSTAAAAAAGAGAGALTGGSSDRLEADSSSSSMGSSSITGSSSLAAVPAAVVHEEGGELDPQQVQRTLGPNGLFRSLVLAGVGSACRAFLHGASRTTISGAEVLAAALERPPGQALITVSNHVGAIDDPLITAALVPQKYLLKPEALRWTMCASDRCFKSRLLAPFFQAAKVLPVERGAGLSQYGMRVAASRLAAGDWVHIFPEGTRSRTGKMGPVRKGVGWLVASCETPPLVVPFVHSGMERILPKGAKLPQTGQEVRVMVGEPVPVDDLLRSAREEGWSDSQLHVAITDRVGQALYSLKAQLEGLPLEEVAPQRAVNISEETLLPLIEEEMDSMRHRWRDSWQRSGLPSLTHRIRAAIAEQAAAYAAQLEASASSTSSAGGGSIAGSGGSSGGLFSSDGEAGAKSEGPLARMYALLYGRSEGGESGASSSSGEASVDGWMLGEQQQGEAEAAEAAGAAAAAAAPEVLLWGAGGPAGQPSSGAEEAGQQQQQQQQQWRRQGVLRMLRGTVRSKLAGARPAAAPAAADLAGGAELSMLSVGLPGAASSAVQEPGPAQLRALVAAAADYSSERAQRMSQLLSGRLAAPCAPAAPSLA